MTEQENLNLSAHTEGSQMTSDKVEQGITLNQVLASETMRGLFGDDAIDTYKRSLAWLRCPPEDIRRNSERFEQAGVRRRVAIALSARVGAASLKDNSKSNR